MKFTHYMFLLCCIFGVLGNSYGTRILGLFPLQGYSHFIMYREVMKSLADAGHQVDVVSHFPLDSEYPNYRDIIDLSGSAERTLNNVSVEMVKKTDGISVDFMVKKTGTEICHLMALPDMQNLAKNPPTNPPYDLVIVEMFTAHCYLAFGRRLNVPVVALSSAPIMIHFNEILGNPLNTAYVKEIPEGSTDYMNFWQRLKNTAFATFFASQIEYHTREQTEIIRKYFGAEMPDVRIIERDIALLLVNSHSTISGLRPLTPAIVEVGGIHVKDDNKQLPTDLQQWMDNSSEGFVFISFGSMVKIESLPKETLFGLYSAFTKLKPTRFLIKIANPEELPPGMPENVKTLSWAPQVQILKHKNIRAFVSHGGIMGLYEAITFAVPVIGVPLFGDQPLNIHNLVQKGAAISLKYEDLADETFVAAVRTITRDPSFRTAMSDLSKQFLDRPMPPRETAVYWIEYILRHGRDALRSPATRLTWWQLALIDVYGAIILSALLLLWLVTFVLTKIARYFVNKSRPSMKKTN